MNEKRFDDLIRRYQSGTCTDQEKVLVEKWLASREESKQSDKLNAEERDQLLAEVSASLFERIEKSKSGRQVTMFPIWKVAAAILLLAVSSYFVWQYASTDSFTTIETLQAFSSGDEVKKTILPDGSIIWLKGNSTLSYPEKFTGNERNVVLTGEALFEVAKDPDHLFNIVCGDMKATVRGTSFNIKATSSNIEVLVLTGKVELTSSKTSQNVIVLPNEKALFSNADNQLAKVQAPEEEPVQVVKGTEYSMNFTRTKMNEVIRRIEGKFNVSVSMDNKNVGNCTISVDLTDQSLDKTLTIASNILGFTYEIKNNKITIHGNGCD